MKKIKQCAITILAVATLAGSLSALENGLARTPPMGFNAYNFSEYVVSQSWKQIALAMTENGMKEIGYNYVNTDGGNSVTSSGGTSKKVKDLKEVITYVHSLGLKAGIYIYPPYNGFGHETQDAINYANFGADFLKFDGWSSTTPANFTAMRDALAACGRPILYSVNGAQGGAVANLWRTSGDIDRLFSSVISCALSNSAGAGKPGSWPDPDMLQVGNLLSDIEDMTHFSLWCINSSPLLIGNDPRSMFYSTHYVVLNTEAIAVNQDTTFSTNPSYGGSGKLIKTIGSLQLWSKTVAGGAKAVVLANTGTTATNGTINWSDIGLASGVAQVRDLWEHKNLGSFTDKYSADIPGRGCVFVKIVAGTTPIPEPPATWYPKPAGFPSNDIQKVTPLAKTGWKATFDKMLYGEPTAWIDGDPTTKVSPADPSGKFTLTIDMASAQSFNCVILTQHEGQDKANFRIGAGLKPYKVYETTHMMEIYVSNDNTTWQGPVATKSCGPHSYTVLASKTVQNARYIRVVEVNSAYPNPETWNGGAGGEVDAYGFRKGIGEVYVANVPDLPAWTLETSTGVAPSAKTIATPLRQSLLPSIAVLPTSGASMNKTLAKEHYLYSLQGRRIVSPKGATPTHRAGIYIVDRRK